MSFNIKTIKLFLEVHTGGATLGVASRVLLNPEKTTKFFSLRLPPLLLLLPRLEYRHRTICISSASHTPETKFKLSFLLDCFKIYFRKLIFPVIHHFIFVNHFSNWQSEEPEKNYPQSYLAQPFLLHFEKNCQLGENQNIFTILKGPQVKSGP